jgi:hypothetical protein
MGGENMVKVKTYKTEVSTSGFLSIEVGTNTPCGGDAGQGGQTVFKLKDLGATGWQLKCDDFKKEQPKEIELRLFGDIEAKSFIEALEFAVSTLKAQREKKVKS